MLRTEHALFSTARTMVAAAAAIVFVTLAPAAARAQDTIVADEFSGSALNTSVWTFVNPVGDASVTVGGGRATVSLPSGSTHDVWGNNNSSTGLRQDVPNRDFEVEAKFDTGVTSAYQMQGIIVEQDGNDLVRAEVHHDGGGTRLFVATIAGGASQVRHHSTVTGGAPHFVRVVRTGNQWRVRYSRDGQSWTTTEPFTFALTVDRMGPLVGNSGNPAPAFAGQIDWFKEILPDTKAPALGNIASSARKIDATITWTTDEPATSEVAYGPTSTYGSAKVGSDDLVTEHSVVIHGLACESTYHYVVRSRDASNNVAASTDRTLTTAACPALPGSDEFSGTAVDMNRWTLVDPRGDAKVTAGDGQAIVSLGAGVQHDIWTGSDTLPRLLQPARNDDFVMGVKFNSNVSAAYQMQGLIVQQDADDLLRLEVHYEGSGTKLFAASFKDGVASKVGTTLDVPDGAPVHLRLRRAGDTWTFSYSADGTNWTKSMTFTRAMTVTAVGLLAGNSGAFPPAFQARADWFRFTPPDRKPPGISDASVTATPGAGSTAAVRWTTDEVASSEVAFGRTANLEGGTISAPGDVTDHVVTLFGLECATTYYFRVRSVDPSGNGTDGTVKSFTSAACPALIESDEFNAASLDTSRWAFIDPLGDSSGAVVSGRAELSVPAGTAHDLWANVNTAPRLLQAARNTDFEVVAKFDTAVSATTQQQGLVVEATPGRRLRFETYYESGNTIMFVAAINGGSAEILHDGVVPGGAPAYMKLRRVGDRWRFSYSNDGEGWRGTTFDRALTVTAVGPYVGNGGRTRPAYQGRIDYFREITDRTPPVIGQIAARPVSRQAQVTWTTEESSSSVVEFRQGTGAWQTRTGPEPLETRHSVALDGLACGTAYDFRVKSADVNGNLATSLTQSLTTTACRPTGGPDVDVWHGHTQTFGQQGIPQTWVNITGNVSDPDGVRSLHGRINANGWETLNFAPDGWRIQRDGDFNYEVPVSELLPGDNYVQLRAIDNGGRATIANVTIKWQGHGAGSVASGSGPVLVIAAHPDDESLGMAGIIGHAKSESRRVYVVIVTNGEGGSIEPALGDCGAAPDAAGKVRYALTRNKEARAAMAVLGLKWTSDLDDTELIFLGYPGRFVRQIAQSESEPMVNNFTGIQHTVAEDFDALSATCNGDFRYLLSGRHSSLSAPAMRADLDALLARTRPSDIYTHSSIDGHVDHSEIARQVVAAVKRADDPVRIHQTIQHPEGDTDCMSLSAGRWPNPRLVDNDPFARFTPTIDFAAPPADICNPASTTTSWGSLGAPNEIVEVPASMQSTSEATNKKWQTISKYETQIDCSEPDDYHVSCGYMRAFAKRSEFFWRYEYGGRRVWQKPFTTAFTSNASIAQQTQILEGQWRYEGNGVRPLTTGFDRALLIGDTGWTDYDVTAPITIHSFDPTTSQGAAVGLALGWQGHNAWGQPRHGHPGGGLCLYARGGSDPLPFKLQLGYSPGPVDDTTLASKEMTLAPGVAYRFRFRQQDGFEPGKTRYSCKVWRADQAEPPAWDLVHDIPDWPGTTGQRSGSAVLLAHEADATFGDATVTPLP